MPTLTREWLGSPEWREHVNEIEKKLDYKVWTDEQLTNSFRATLGARPTEVDLDQGLWVFAYGSLIWNPLLNYDLKAEATIRGYSRRFCLKTVFGRGSPDNPGLVLALDAVENEQDIRTQGRAFHLKPETLEEDLFLLWRREMLAGSYKPLWIKGDVGGEPTWMISFAINRATPRYDVDQTHADTLHMLRNGSGLLGSSLEYFRDTLECFRQEGIVCPYLEALELELKSCC